VHEQAQVAGGISKAARAPAQRMQPQLHCCCCFLTLVACYLCVSRDAQQKAHTCACERAPPRPSRTSLP
jgi:hypothetical protein